MDIKISGVVVRGDGYGKRLGFPTINLDTNVRGVVLPGVYAGEVYLRDAKYKAGIAVNENGKIDAHLIDYSGDAYDEDVVIELNKFLREYKNFNTEEELINQIKKDIDLCSKI